ncbi:MAG: hypothetical protein J07HX5_00279 [halophilic archaeon J07HX5]|nr:MAG: hypothetical protein J07HX5_00279 [halophilic archaeon J07HX5]
MLRLEPDELEQLRNAFTPAAPCSPVVYLKWFANDCSDSQAFVDARCRVLIHHLCVLAPPLERPPPERGHVGAVDRHRPGVGLLESEQCPPECCLATARLADNPERFAAIDLE